MDKYTDIIWDWNGTLIDDVHWSIESMNKVLLKRGLKPIETLEEYQYAFEFPVINYYKNLGFDFNKYPFEELSKEFINNYYGKGMENCNLHKNTKLVLKEIKNIGINQIILSASEINNLKNQLDNYNIDKYFSRILGIENIYAKSKFSIAKKYVENKDRKKVLFIGDTHHDKEIAENLDCDFIFVEFGHGNKKDFNDCKGISNTIEILEYL